MRSPAPPAPSLGAPSPVAPTPAASPARPARAGEPDLDPHVGPFASRSRAVAALEALQAAHQVRQCGGRLPVVPAASATACALAEMGRCSAPCVPPDRRPQRPRDVEHSAESYPDVIDALRTTMAGDASPVVDALAQRIAALVRDERFEDAAGDRDRLEAYLSGAARAQRLAPLTTCQQLVAARPGSTGGWEIVVVRYGRLAATAVCERTGDPLATVAAAVAAAEHVDPPAWPAPACHPEESDLIIGWLSGPGVRLVEVSDPLTCPVRGAERHVVNTSTAQVVAQSVPAGPTGWPTAPVDQEAAY